MTFRAVPGQIVDVLLAAARDAAMLVVGSRGPGAASGVLPAFTALSLVRFARCPVAVVPDRGARPEPSPQGPVVVGFVPEPGSQAALELAAELAAAWDVRLRVVHAVLGRSRGARETQVHVHRLLEDQMADLTTRIPDLRVEHRFAADTPLRSLLAEAETARAVVVGQRSRTSALGVAGSTSRSVIECGSCPVVVAPLMAAVP